MMEKTTIFLGILWKGLVKNMVLVVSVLGLLVYRSAYTQRDFVAFFDVGQGDSALISIGDYQVLIDGGPGDYALYQLSSHMPPWDMIIETVVLTHPHADHIDGLSEVMSRYEIGEVLYNNVCYGLGEYIGDIDVTVGTMVLSRVHGNRTGKLLSIKQTPIDYTNEGCVKSWDGNINNDSLVFELIYGEYRILFMGDAEIELEEYLISSNQLNDVDILKAGHHCSNTSSSLELLKTVKPELVVCSYGEDNKYGHPSEEVIDRFNRLGINYVSTQEEGNIVVWLE